MMEAVYTIHPTLARSAQFKNAAMISASPGINIAMQYHNVGEDQTDFGLSYACRQLRMKPQMKNPMNNTTDH
jgi:hypothetical protein